MNPSVSTNQAGDLMSPIPTMSNKALDDKVLEDTVELVVEEEVKYECCVCGDGLPLSQSVATCTEHFMCNQCIIDAHDIALKDNEAFPAQCCTPLPLGLVEHLLSPETCTAYLKKTQEHNTPIDLRVYCCKEDCRSFIPVGQFDSITYPLHTIARCKCGYDTCTECGKEWDGDDHICEEDEDDVRPDWMPEYSASCRIKRCPDCLTWIELKEACNHMLCSLCKSEFCFVCLQPWSSRSTGFHKGEGCPAYGDPIEGYDDEGFELTKRGIHRDTGMNRDGLNLLELHPPKFAHGDVHILLMDHRRQRYHHDPANDNGVEHIEFLEDQNFWANIPDRLVDLFQPD